jgi:ubiquinone/menaquinone biosynthesis C-methylase UbiE
MISLKKTQRKKDFVLTGLMAKGYDYYIRELRLAEIINYADIVSGHASPGGKILEVAPGSGHLSIELAKRNFVVAGVEISNDCVKIEKRNAEEAGVKIDFLQGNASALTQLDNIFDFIICSEAFRYFKEPLKTLNEMHRVLKPGGAVLIIDMNRDATNEDIDKEIQKINMKKMKKRDIWFFKMLFKTLRRGAYAKCEFEELITETNFFSHKIEKHKEIGLSVWLYK